MEFFEVSPLGRILNRFSSDTNTVDDSLPFDINILLAQFAAVLGKCYLNLIHFSQFSNFDNCRLLCHHHILIDKWAHEQSGTTTKSYEVI